MKKENKWAFSLVEMMVALIAIACIAASVTPIVTKKITGRKLNLSTNLVNLTIDCEEKFGPECKLCEKTKRCLVCNKLCSAGTYTETETCNCIACTTIDINCKLCQKGAQCTQCKPGYYLENNTCKICPKGHKCSSGVTKDICNVGEYQDKEGQTSCLKCAAGTYNPNKGLTTVCPACPAGKYNLTQGNSSCLTCEAGYYCPGGSGHGDCWTKNAHYSHAGASSCSACWAGTYATDASGNWSGNYRGTTCITCPVGWKCNGTPVACGAGTCQNLPGKSSCKNCSSVVSFCSNCSTTTCGCSSCNSGYTLVSGRCCPNRAACISYNSNCACVKCSPGYYVSNGSCVICPVGYKCDGVSAARCPNGSYNSTQGNTGCASCPAGYYCVNGGAYQCPAGQYQPYGGQSSCYVCGAGYYQPYAGATACYSCGVTGCASYSSGCTCSSCSSGYFLRDGVCVYCVSPNWKCGNKCCSCPAGTFGVPSLDRCFTAGDATAGSCTAIVGAKKTCVAGNSDTSGCCYSNDAGYFGDFGAARGGCINAGGRLPTKSELKTIMASYRAQLGISDNGDAVGGNKCKSNHDGNQCWKGRLFVDDNDGSPDYCKWNGTEVWCTGSYKNYARPIRCSFAPSKS